MGYTDAELVDALPALRRVAGSWLAADIEDLIQDTCLRALRYRDKFIEGSLESWLIVIMRNALANRGRGADAMVRWVVDADDDAMMHHAVEPPQEVRVLANQVATLIGSGFVSGAPALVPAAEGYSYEEMAVRFGWDESVLRSRLFRAKRSLRELVA